MADPTSPLPGPFSGRASLLRRLLPLLLLAGLAVWFLRGSPRETRLVYDLGARRQGLQSLAVRVVRLPDRALERQVEFRYAPAAAPLQQSHVLKLAPGDYALEMTLEYAGGREQLERSVRFDGEDEVVVPM